MLNNFVISFVFGGNILVLLFIVFWYEKQIKKLKGGINKYPTVKIPKIPKTPKLPKPKRKSNAPKKS